MKGLVIEGSFAITHKKNEHMAVGRLIAAIASEIVPRKLPELVKLSLEKSKGAGIAPV